jgi:hypothetical protein
MVAYDVLPRMAHLAGWISLCFCKNPMYWFYAMINFAYFNSQGITSSS